MSHNNEYRLTLMVLVNMISYLLIIHGLSSFYFFIHTKGNDIYQSFGSQFYLMVILSFMISVFVLLIHYYRKLTERVFSLILIQWIILLMLGYPLGSDLLIETLLFSGLIIETIIVLRNKKLSYITLAIILLSFVLMQHKTNYDNQNIESPELVTLLMYTALLFAFAGLVVWLKALYLERDNLTREIQEFKTSSARLINTNRSFQEYAYNIERQSTDQERSRLSRELHDIIGYTMVSISMMMEDAIDKHIKKEYDPLFSIIVNTRDHARSAHQEIRDILITFREQKHSKVRFLNELHRMLEVFSEASGVAVTLKAPEVVPHLSKEYRYHLIRIIQEGLTNAIHHGKADRIEIILTSSKNILSLVIEDNGIGTKVLIEGIGISGMRERLNIMHGSIQIHSGNHYFRLTINIPLDGMEG